MENKNLRMDGSISWTLNNEKRVEFFKNKSLMLPLYDLSHGEGIRGGCELICMPNNEYDWKKKYLWKHETKSEKEKIFQNFCEKKYSKYSEF